MARTKAIGRARPDREYDIDLYWANRRAAAKTPRAQASVEFDRLRVAASKLTPGEETALWRVVIAYLAQHCKQAAERHGP